jgi:hypothetical protein
MKKIFMILAVVMLVAFNCNVQANNISKKKSIEETVMRISNELSQPADSMNVYNIDLKKNFDKLEKFLQLNNEQADDLLRIHDSVMKSFEYMGTIDDDTVRNNYFNSLISFWRQNSYNSIMLNVDYDNDYIRDDAKRTFRLYWTIVNATINNKGIIDKETGRLSVMNS